MERKKEIRYPLGMQTFSRLREEGCLYVDKTDLVYELTHDMSRYIFLSRPRRFGKSLLVSTLRSYFEGRRELFEGLAIEGLEKEWRKHPVLHFSMAGGIGLWGEGFYGGEVCDFGCWWLCGVKNVG